MTCRHLFLFEARRKCLDIASARARINSVFATIDYGRLREAKLSLSHAVVGGSSGTLSVCIWLFFCAVWFLWCDVD